MKGINARRLFVLLLAGAFALGGATSWARPPRARQANGVVRCIDRQARTICLLPVEGGEPLVFTWKRDTRFVRNSTFDSPEALRQQVREDTARAREIAEGR